MIQFVCSKCPAGYLVYGTWFKIQELLVAHPMWREKDKGCPLCGEVLLLGAPKLREPHRKWRRIEVEEFFKALCGFGLPEELGCTPKAVAALMQANPIIGIDMAAAGSERTVVYALILGNDMRLHLASSPEGPCIYKITRTQNGHSNSNHLPKKAADVSVQCPHQGISAGEQEADAGSGVSNASSDINAEGAGGTASADTTLQERSVMDASHSMGAAARGSAYATSS
jgi:hypothetical protein